VTGIQTSGLDRFGPEGSRPCDVYWNVLCFILMHSMFSIGVFCAIYCCIVCSVFAIGVFCTLYCCVLCSILLCSVFYVVLYSILLCSVFYTPY